jgi:ComF family protein
MELRVSLERWLGNPLRQLVGSGRCLLCSCRNETLLCQACFGDLPWNHCACQACARPLPVAGTEQCRYCQRQKPPFDAAVAAFRYESPIDRSVHSLKYNADFLAARWLADCLVHAVHRSGRPLPDRLLPVPLHSGRLRRRGYNQAQELARHIGRALGVPVHANQARRQRATDDQIGKTAHERRRNVRGAFAIDESVRGHHIALIDDVMTTGSTLGELARSCRQAGATSVDCWVIARVE